MNPTGIEILVLGMLCVLGIIGMIKLLALADEANQHIDGSFSTEWGKK